MLTDKEICELKSTKKKDENEEFRGEERREKESEREEARTLRMRYDIISVEKNVCLWSLQCNMSHQIFVCIFFLSPKEGKFVIYEFSFAKKNLIEYFLPKLNKKLIILQDEACDHFPMLTINFPVLTTSSSIVTI